MRRADNLTTFMCRLSRNSGASASCNPKGLSRPVAGKLYLTFVQKTGHLIHEDGTDRCEKSILKQPTLRNKSDDGRIHVNSSGSLDIARFYFQSFE